MKNFSLLGLPDELVAALERMQITTPTPIQSATIPLALGGADLLASAQTGSGKTVAYSIPLIIKLTSSPQGTALILAPTRELAMQVYHTIQQILGKSNPFKIALLIGGAPMFKQISELRRGPKLIVGTPGRILDHLTRGTLSLKKTEFLIIDEVDNMLDMGFSIQLEQIAEYLPETRQTLMFSATLPPNIERLSHKYLRNPQRIAIGSAKQAAPKIKQEIIHTKSGEKFPKLIDQIQQRAGSIIIFVKTRRGAERLSQDLQDHDLSVDAIHGDLPQRRRERVLFAFRSQKIRILVATDVAARGLDIPHVMHVINYDLPQCGEDYIHRIGRTGRAGAEGSAVCFISHEDGHKGKIIARMIDPEQKQSAGHSNTPGRFERAGNSGNGRRFEKPGYSGNARRFDRAPGPGNARRSDKPGFFGNARRSENADLSDIAGAPEFRKKHPQNKFADKKRPFKSFKGPRPQSSRPRKQKKF